MKRLMMVAMVGAMVGCVPEADVVVSPKGEVQSIAHALGKVREMRAKGEMPREKIAQIAVLPGRYHVSETIVLTPEDSNIRLIGAGYEKSVIDGGVEIGPFTDKGGIWEAPVPRGFVFEQLWVNDKRAQRARTPNGGRFLYMKEPDNESPVTNFFAEKQDIECLTKLSAADLKRALLVYWQSWDMGFAMIKSVDATTGRIVTNRKQRRSFFFWDKTRPRYAIENVREALDAEGEWFLDEKESKLLYIPRQGETIGQTKAYAPKLTTLVKIEGNVGKGAMVKNLTFEGIGFEFSRMEILPEGINNAQAASNVRTALIEGLGVEEMLISKCRVAHTGGHGLWLHDGSTKSKIVHTLVEDLGAGGIYLGDGRKWIKPSELKFNSSFITVEDSIVRHGGRILEGAIGVWMGHVSDCKVVHNEICDFRYTGVSMGWTWGYAETATRRNHVDFNHIHHIQQGRLSDGGAFYSLGNQEGGTVCNNWAHDVYGYRDNGSPAWGLYTDEGSTGILLASNLVERCRSGAIHQHYGKENKFVNNIFATFDDFGAWRSRRENHTTIEVKNNIFWWTNKEACAYTIGGGNGPMEDLPADGNIYWCEGGKVAEKAFNRATFAEWQKGGKDLHGAIADPLFVDAANGDWRLKPDSPALKAGFKPFDWREAGVYKDDEAWVKKAAEKTWDEFVDAARAPEYFRTKVAFNAENLGLGELKNTMGSLAPLQDSAGKEGAIAIVGDNVAEGKRALEFREVGGMKYSFCPMVNFKCRVAEGTSILKFSVMPFENSDISIEYRDYDSAKPFAAGPSIRLSGGKIYAGGKLMCKSEYGKWIDVEVTVTFSGSKRGQWKCRATVRGQEPVEMDVGKFSDKFKRLTWVGFISYGKDGSKWRLDDIRLMPQE